MKRIALVPAYKPESIVVEVVRDLLRHGFAVIVVNDGSGSDFQVVFDQLSSMEQVKVLTHAINVGKGAALKTGINHICEAWGDGSAIVTLDADGQHEVDDVLNVANALERNPESLILGARSFAGDVPVRSRLGNTCTRFLVRTLHGLDLTDTQTGLRGFCATLAKNFLTIRSQRYDFELDMLIAASKMGIGIEEVGIKTVYINDNRSSHFNPLFDSAKIYFSLFRFLSAGLVAAVIDNLIFIVLFYLGWPIFLSQATGRAIVMVINYLMVRNMVFHSGERHVIAIPKYVATVIVLGCLSYGLIVFASDYLSMPVVAAKIVIESIIFVSSFLAQRVFVFKENAAR